ncbi:MAG: HNH endonuclease signature motif containing protein [Bacteroidota bacterium]
MPSLPKSKRRKWIPAKPKQEGRKESNQSIYNSTRWRKLRKLVIEAQPLCKVCEYIGEVVAAQVVDHVVPINEGGATWNEENLCPMCHKHHNRKSGYETRGMMVMAKPSPNGLIPKDLETIENMFEQLTRGEG